MTEKDWWRMEVETRCIRCDRAVSFLIGDGVDPIRELHNAGACIVGPTLRGRFVVDGCRKCLRYEPYPSPGVEE